MAMPAEKMPPMKEAAPEPPKEPKDSAAKKIIEEHQDVFNFTYDEFEEQMEKYNEVVNELGDMLESYGVDMQPTEVLDSPLKAMGSKKLSSTQKKELEMFFEDKNAREVNEKWDKMQKKVADFPRA